jgi:hypothetical protein
MSCDDLRAKNARLHDRIEQVIEMHPELRALTEAKALSQDLYVEVGAPFLERTQGKLRERARAIIKHRPELESYFDDFPLTEVASGNDTRDTKLIAALDRGREAIRWRGREIAMNDERRTRIREALALVQAASRIIHDVWIEEDVFYDGPPENVSGSPKSRQSHAAVQALERAIGALDALEGHLEFVIEPPT